MFCLVYGFANAAAHSWGTPSTWGLLAAGAALLATFAAWQARTADPLLPPRVVLDRNRGGAYLAMLFVSAGVFGIFLFLAFYLQTTLGYSPLVTGLAFLPFPAAVVASVNVGQIVLMPRTGPKPLVGLGLLIAAGGMVWLTRIGVHSGYASAVLGPLLVTGIGIGQVTAPAVNTGTYGVAPYDAGVACGDDQRRTAGRRLDRHLAAQHDGGQRHRQLPGVAPEPGDHPHRSCTHGAGPAVAGARLCRRLLVDGGHLRRRRHCVRDAAATRAAAPSAGTRRHGPGTKGCALGTTVRSAEGSLIRGPIRGRGAADPEQAGDQPLV